MQRRILHAVSLLLVWSSVAMPTCAQAVAAIDTSPDLPVTTPNSESGDVIRKVLDEGYAFERDRQWADALLHYEEALRKYPEQREFQNRLNIVRIRYDLARRYADKSFVESTRGLAVTQALEVFEEVCVKIESHYVETPNWRAIALRGNRHLEIALRDAEFLQVNEIKVNEIKGKEVKGKEVKGEEAAIDAVIRHLFDVARQTQFNSRQDVKSFVLSMAQYCQKQLALKPVSTILEYVCGATGSLDEYSTFLTPEQLNDVYSQIEGNFVGMGIELKATSGALLLTHVIPGGPASKSGLKPGDRIVEVDGQSMDEISAEKAADLLKGEQGSVVKIAVLDKTGEKRQLSITRERVEVPSVEGVRIVDQDAGIAYLKVTSFQKTTSRDVDAALWQLHRQGMRSLIVDVRKNPGGLLTESVEVADKFVSDGTIVSTRGRSAREDFDYKAHRPGTWRVALVVLIDEDSASASEIFAGAIRDHHRGRIVGSRSYGKGSVQGIFPLRVAGTGVRLTTAKFYSPSGQAISHRGVTPDVVVRNPETKSIDDAADPVLAAGIEQARQLVAQVSSVANAQ